MGQSANSLNSDSPEFCVARRILENRCLRKSAAFRKHAGVVSWALKGLTKLPYYKALTRAARLSDVYWLDKNLQENNETAGHTGFRRHMTHDGHYRSDSVADNIATVGNSVGLIPGIGLGLNILGDVGALGVRLARMPFTKKYDNRWFKSLQGLYDAGIDPDKPFGDVNAFGV